MASDTISVCDHGQLLVAEAFLPVLRHLGCARFADIMAWPAQDVVRQFPGRTTVRVVLASAAGEPVPVFLKRYETGYLSAWRLLLRALRWPGCADEAMREWRMLHGLRAQGFGTPAPLAVGQEKTWGVVTRSFVMTAELDQAAPADQLVKLCSPPQRRELARRLGEMTRRFHRAGFVHKDYYLSHVFVAARGRELELSLIDLQRVTQPRVFPQRWRVKDLGALAYSALKAGAAPTDLMRFYKLYAGVSKLTAREKRLARRIQRRVAWLCTRRPRHDADFVPWARPVAAAERNSRPEAVRGLPRP